jgi:glycosyltransferase involved in cell wall biosynthesis
MNNPKITILVKVFNRKKALFRLLKSIKENLSEMPLIILDDSFLPVKIPKQFSEMNINLIRTGIDVGLSRGRNIMLEEVKTEYFLLLEEDFIFKSNNGVYIGLEMLTRNNLDILGGELYDVFELNSIYSFFTLLIKPNKIGRLNKNVLSESYRYDFEISESNLLINLYKNSFNRVDCLMRTDQVNNFFIGRTASIRDMGGWTPESLKLGEHRLFFVKAKMKNIKVAYTNSFRAYHIRNVPLIYYPFRIWRLNKYHKIALEEYSKMGIKNSQTYVKN